MKIINVVGARPNFMKIAPLMKEMRKCQSMEVVLVHTGQHYDGVMSKLFFQDLGIPKPDINLEVGSASHAIQTALIMQRFEDVLLKEKPSLVIVVGDVNSTIACALTSVKLNIPVAHVEAGLRSFDRTMPEEINRVLTDAISDILFTTEKSASENLLREGIAKEKVHFVGNVMIDTLLKHKEKANRSDILSRIGVKERSYGLVTLHRPSNVDSRNTLKGILCALKEVSQNIPLILPCHPRTIERIKSFNLSHYIIENNAKASVGVNLYAPLRYLEFLKLMAMARVVLTDSGGIQEETTVLGVPCITLRENTERPVTVTEGTNIVVGTGRNKIVKKTLEILNKHTLEGQTPEFWDGKASKRIVKLIIDYFS
jgi:UDP-N-acetylglucosamine 2-epimerase (non-hydrolysing)